MSHQTILVTTATGTVGGHVATLLLEQGFRVNALVRNPDSDAAQKLKAQGVKLFKGDFDDVPSMEAAAQGIHGVFINNVPSMTNMDEYKQNNNIITAARKAGAKIGVYMSIVMADLKDQFPGYGPENPSYNYFEAKYLTEKALQEAGFDHWTIIRTAWFLSNFNGNNTKYLWPYLQKEHKLVYPSLKSDTQFPMTDPLDIGKFCATPFWKPQTFDQQIVDLKTEDVTLTKLAETMTKVTGIPIEVEFISQEEAKARDISIRPILWEMWRINTGFQVDVQRLKKFSITRSSVEAYFDRNKDQVVKFLSQ
ncbi:hypothetical protein NQZ79_g8321 [Umbelopsis isabellina]|nr:hypothetical protein NQZ79_g8321 [Umbelopsis isabellina]